MIRAAACAEVENLGCKSNSTIPAIAVAQPAPVPAPVLALVGPARYHCPSGNRAPARAGSAEESGRKRRWKTCCFGWVASPRWPAWWYVRWAVYGRLSGNYYFGGFQVGTLLQAGTVALLVACVCFLMVLTGRPRR